MALSQSALLDLVEERDGGQSGLGISRWGNSLG